MEKTKTHTKNGAGLPLDETFWLRCAPPSSFLYATFAWPLGDPFERSQGLLLDCFGLEVEEDGVSWGSEGQRSVRPRARVITSITAARCSNCSLWSLSGRAFIFFEGLSNVLLHPVVALQPFHSRYLKRKSGYLSKEHNWTLFGLCLNYMWFIVNTCESGLISVVFCLTFLFFVDCYSVSFEWGGLGGVFEILWIYYSLTAFQRKHALL